jgi:hypothetical protein
MGELPSGGPDRVRRKSTIRAWAGILAAVVLAGCTSSSNPFGSSSDGSSMGQRFSQLFSSGSANASPNPGGPNKDIDCPPVDIRQGASTFSVNAPGPDTSALSLRYQGVFGQTARECAALGATMTIKLGVQGRVILGPAGGPGQIEVPMRFALVREGPEPKTIWTKFYKIPVTLEPGQNNVPFTYVEEDMTFPTPKPDDLDAYVIYVGFDPMGLGRQAAPPKRQQKQPPRRQ